MGSVPARHKKARPSSLLPSNFDAVPITQLKLPVKKSCAHPHGHRSPSSSPSSAIRHHSPRLPELPVHAIFSVFQDTRSPSFLSPEPSKSSHPTGHVVSRPFPFPRTLSISKLIQPIRITTSNLSFHTVSLPNSNFRVINQVYCLPIAIYTKVAHSPVILYPSPPPSTPGHQTHQHIAKDF